MSASVADDDDMFVVVVVVVVVGTRAPPSLEQLATLLMELL